MQIIQRESGKKREHVLWKFIVARDSTGGDQRRPHKIDYFKTLLWEVLFWSKVESLKIPSDTGNGSISSSKY